MNIFLIYTPLHSLIATKIIKDSNIENYTVIYIGRCAKDKKYYNRFSVNSVKSYYINKTSIFYLILKLTFISISLKFKYKKINFFTGNPKTFLSRFFLIFQRFELFTFDDGYANIDKSENTYFRVLSENRYLFLFFLIFRKALIYKNFIESIKFHYTIFNKSNIFKNIKYVKLIDEVLTYDSIQDCKNIFLSSDIYESNFDSLKNEIMLYKSLVDKYKIDTIIEHPGSKHVKFFEEDVTKVYQGDLIAEEYILNLVKYYNVNIYGFQCSTLYILEGISDRILTFDLGSFSECLNKYSINE